jgi:hypothetical protein
VAGAAVHAVDGQGVAAAPCQATPAGTPCLAYVNDAGRPDLTLGATGASGRFALFGAASPVTVTAIAPATAATLGPVSAPVFTGGVSLIHLDRP